MRDLIKINCNNIERVLESVLRKIDPDCSLTSGEVSIQFPDRFIVVGDLIRELSPGRETLKSLIPQNSGEYINNPSPYLEDRLSSGWLSLSQRDAHRDFLIDQILSFQFGTLRCSHLTFIRLNKEVDLELLNRAPRICFLENPQRGGDPRGEFRLCLIC